MLLWMEEARQHQTLSDLVRSLRGLPEGAQPLFMLTEKSETTVRHRLSPGRRPLKYTRGSGTQFATLGRCTSCSSS
jgi:hypothetical protein